MNNLPTITLVIGASSGIGQAIIHQLAHKPNQHIIAVSRKKIKTLEQYINVEQLNTNYSEQSISAICQYLKEIDMPCTKVFICNGTLHGQWENNSTSTTNEKHSYAPEKKIEDVSTNNLSNIIQVNTIIPFLWCQQLISVLKHQHNCVLTVFSARVGSISDNQSGGWYSYRSSKAALNMLLKTAAIEYARRAKNVKLVSFHPGTTNTHLSKPFQANVKPEKLFTPEFVAQQLLAIVDKLPHDNQASFIDWQGNKIEW